MRCRINNSSLLASILFQEVFDDFACSNSLEFTFRSGLIMSKQNELETKTENKFIKWLYVIVFLAVFYFLPFHAFLFFIVSASYGFWKKIQERKLLKLEAEWAEEDRIEKS